MPIPERRRSGLVDHVDPQAVGRGDGASLIGEHLRADLVGSPVGQGPGEVRSIPDDGATLGCGQDDPGIGTGGNEDELFQLRRRQFGIRAIERLRVERSLHDAPGDKLGGARGSPVQPGERREPDGQAADLPPGEPADRGRADLADRLAVEGGRVAGRHRQDAPDGEVTGRREGVAEPLRLQLAERGQGGELTPASPIELAERAVECRIAGDRDDEHIGLDVPGLVRDEAQLHRARNLRSRNGPAGPGRTAGRATAPAVSVAPRGGPAPQEARDGRGEVAQQEARDSGGPALSRRGRG